MTNAEKHALFQLTVQEHGVTACLNRPETMTTFLLLLAEAITSGFFAEANASKAKA